MGAGTGARASEKTGAGQKRTGSATLVISILGILKTLIDWLIEWCIP